MIIKYNSLNRLEKPKLTLCSPGARYNNGTLTNAVGILSGHEAEEIVFNFNSTSELNFRLNRITCDNVDENAYIYSMYKKVQNRRLIFLEDIGFFVISNIEDGYENGTHYKDVQAQSIDVEISQKKIPFIANNTYKFTSDETGANKGIIEIIAETIPLWTIGYVDDVVANKWRTFEDVDITLNCLSFLLEDIQDAYECIVVFDCIHRIINVYDQSNYVRQTDIHITKDDLINSISVTENADDLYTAISVVGNENVTISAINPLGTNVIYNFNYYLDWMSPSLKTKVVAWQDAIEAKKAPYYDINLQYHNKLTEASNLQLEIDKFNTQITMYSRCRDNIVAESNTDIVNSYNVAITENGGSPITIHDEISETLAEIDNLIATCEYEQANIATRLDSINQDISSLQNSINEIHNELSMTEYFSEEEYSELYHYIYEGDYSDEHVTITDIMSYDEKFNQMKVLYDRAEMQLKKISEPTQEFSIDVENFIFTKEFEKFAEQLETGCLINVEIDTDDIALLFLSNITVNYDDRTLNMTFGNRFNKFDPKSLFNDVLGNVNKSANTISYIKDVLYPIRSGEFNTVKESLQTSKNITMGGAISSDNEEVVIDGSGYTGKRQLENGAYDPRQIKIIGKAIVFTDDAWDTCKVALGELVLGDGETTYGINADSIIGDLIMGNNLRIVDNDGNDLLSVVDGKIKTQVDNVDGRLTSIEQNANNVNIRITALEDKGDEVQRIRTSMGYTFDDDGLFIHKEDNEMENILDYSGMYVTRIEGDQVEKGNILTANNEGVNAINLTARQYLTIGTNSRFEDYSNDVDTRRTACFFIGG